MKAALGSYCPNSIKKTMKAALGRCCLKSILKQKDNDQTEKVVQELPSLYDIALLAYNITSEDWSYLDSITDDAGLIDCDIKVPYSSDLNILVDRILALLLIRIFAIFFKREQEVSGNSSCKLLDLSTTTICRSILNREITDWPTSFTPKLLSQLRSYVFEILSMYRKVHYHNVNHGYHVFVCANKLLDFVLLEYDYHKSADKGKNTHETQNSIPFKLPQRPTYGLKNDPLAHFALLFSALIHDVDHMGISNRQLALESHHLAILYNDQSCAEQRSLSIAFSLLMQQKYQMILDVIIKNNQADILNGTHNDYTKFRSMVIDLVLCTDIASPERVQITKSKFKEAFGGDPSNFMNSQSSESGLENKMFFCGGIDEEEEQSLHRDDDSEEGMKYTAKESCTASTTNDPEMNLSRGVLEKTHSTDFRKRTLIELRRCSLPNMTSSKKSHRKLGIKTAMDLSGVVIEPFSTKANSISDHDEPNELKMIVLMELILKAADVSANLQCWHNMVQWSGNLYHELKASSLESRGVDPGPIWIDSQIAFYESYTMPLVEHMIATKAFEEGAINSIVNNISKNISRWLVQGPSCVENFKTYWEKMEP